MRMIPSLFAGACFGCALADALMQGEPLAWLAWAAFWLLYRIMLVAISLEKA